ncbi:tyrosine-type recombinase/integrase [Micromonospora echinaurantiaca]|uniref:tyrosine-type recombinase/integrase n=1 Tax=Micromonospora echinaurantiaca TaxID=47857 RepID=UPI003791595B
MRKPNQAKPRNSAVTACWPDASGAPHFKAHQHSHMLRHTFVTTMLDAGVSLRDVQTAARHADP